MHATVPALLLLLAPGAARALTQEEAVEVLKKLDQREKTGDSKLLVYLELKERDKADTAQEAIIYRRSADGKLLILFVKPKTEQGKGYLRMEKNLWSYDPTIGKWERKTERERIGGSTTRRRDFDESRLAEEYNPEFVGEEKLGAFEVWRLKLTVKEGVDVAYPVMELWIDKATGNKLKSQERALSGRLMRTAYYPKWQKIYSESKGAEVWIFQEARFYDEVDKANSTTIVVRSVDLRPLDTNIFTKAWLESKSR